MKAYRPLRLATSLITLLAAPGLAQAHPGHAALDWFSALPHAGHGNDYATSLLALGLTCALLGSCWLISRKR